MRPRLTRFTLVAALVLGSFAVPVAAQSIAPADPLTPLWDDAGPPSRAHHRAIAPLAPFVTASMPEDAAWEGFTKPGTAGGGFLIGEWHGKLVLGGCLAAGHTAMNGIALWDGTKFEGLPSPGFVQMMTIWNDRIVVAVYGVSGHWPILGFNGTSWDTLGVPNNLLYCLSTFGGKLVAGGRFTAMNGVAANRVAAYDGTTWTAFGSGFTGADDQVERLGVHAGALIAAGSILGGKRIGAWNSAAGTWDVLGQGLGSGGEIDALNSDGVSLYVTGHSLTSAGTPLGAIARWDGVGWNSVPGATGQISTDATMWNGRLITTIPRPPIAGLSQWDGVTLSAVSGDSLAVAPLGGQISHVGTWGTRLVVTGGFRGNGSVFLPSVAIFDGAQWTTPAIPWEPSMLSPGFVFGLGKWNDKLLVGTSTLLAQQDHYVLMNSGIPTFDGSHWAPFGANRVLAAGEYFTTWNSDLVVAGYGLSVSGTSIHGIARWNGSTWSGVGSNPPFDIVAIQAVQNDLYVINYDDENVDHLNGTTWEPLGGLGGPPFTAVGPLALATDGNVLIVGGYFTTAGGAPANNIATWDGTSWHALGAGFNDGVGAIGVWNGLIVAGGPFTQSGGQPVAGAAYWNGTTWQQMGSNVVDLVYIENEGGELFASGDFRLPSGAVVQAAVAHWTGTDWHLLGSGGGRYEFEIVNGYLYQSGAGLVNGQASHGLSRVPLSAVLGVPRPNSAGARIALSVSPNPARSLAGITFTLPAASHARVRVFDAAGRLVATLADGAYEAGPHRATWSTPGAPGVYMALLETGVGRVSRRFVVLER